MIISACIFLSFSLLNIQSVFSMDARGIEIKALFPMGAGSVKIMVPGQPDFEPVEKPMSCLKDYNSGLWTKDLAQKIKKSPCEECILIASGDAVTPVLNCAIENHCGKVKAIILGPIWLEKFDTSLSEVATGNLFWLPYCLFSSEEWVCPFYVPVDKNPLFNLDKLPQSLPIIIKAEKGSDGYFLYHYLKAAEQKRREYAEEEERSKKPCVYLVSPNDAEEVIKQILIDHKVIKDEESQNQPESDLASYSSPSDFDMTVNRYQDAEDNESESYLADYSPASDCDTAEKFWPFYRRACNVYVFDRGVKATFLAFILYFAYKHGYCDTIINHFSGYKA